MTEPDEINVSFRPMRAVRRKLDVTQRELAHACHVYAKAPVYWERDERSPSADALLRAAIFLGVPLWKLYTATAVKPARH